MKLHDKVRLVSHKKKFLQEGYDVGAVAHIIEEKQGDYWLIEFLGESKQSDDGTWYYTGEIMTALDEDLEVIAE